MPANRQIKQSEVVALKTKLDEILSHRGGTTSVWGWRGWHGVTVPVVSQYITKEQGDDLINAWDKLQNDNTSYTRNVSLFNAQDYDDLESWVNYYDTKWDHPQAKDTSSPRAVNKSETFISAGTGGVGSNTGCAATCMGLCTTACYYGCKSGCGSTCSSGCTGREESNNSTVSDYQAHPTDDSGCNGCGSTCGGTCASGCSGTCAKGCSGSCASGATKN